MDMGLARRGNPRLEEDGTSSVLLFAEENKLEYEEEGTRLSRSVCISCWLLQLSRRLERIARASGAWRTAPARETKTIHHF